MTTETDAVVESKPAQGSRWEDFVDVYLSPGELFGRRAHDSWGKPFLLLALICAVLYYAFLPINALVWDAMMVANAPEGADIERMRQGAAFMKYLGGIFVPIGLAFGITISAVAVRLLSAVFEPSANWRQSFLIATYGAYVVLPQQIITSLFVFIRSRSNTITPNDISFGALRFLDEPSKILTAALRPIDVFPIWGAIICAVGLMVVVGMPRTRAIMVAALSLIATVLPGVAIAALTGGK
jgi:hypothetical protein